VAEQPSWQEQLHRQPKALRKDALRRLIRQEVGLLARLGRGELPDAAAGFFDLGLDSVALVNIGATIERELAVQVGPTLIFEHPTIDALTDHLWSIVRTDMHDTEIRHDAPANDAKTAAPVSGLQQPSVAAEFAALKALLGSETAG
jgi:acyl carrier protein